MSTKKSTPTTPSIHDKLTILKHLAGGRNADMVAAAMRMTRYQVIDIASDHGYPDPVKMAKAVTLITQRLDAEANPARGERQRRVDEAIHSGEMEGETTTAATEQNMAAYVDGEITSDQLVERTRNHHGLGDDEKLEEPASPKPSAALAPATPPPTSTKPTAVDQAPAAGGDTDTDTDTDTASDIGPALGPLTKPDEIRVLLNTAKTLTSKRIERQTEKVFNEIARLRELVAAEQAKAEAKAAEKAAQKAERDAARAEIQRLEEQLRQAKARLRRTAAPSTAVPAPAASTSRPTVADEPSAKEIRAWALQQEDLTCPAYGRIPAKVRTAYDAAHQTAAA